MLSTGNPVTQPKDDHVEIYSSGPSTWSSSPPLTSDSSPKIPSNVSVLVPETSVFGYHNTININSKRAPKEILGATELCNNNDTQLGNYNNVSCKDATNVESKSNVIVAHAESNASLSPRDGAVISSSGISISDNLNKVNFLKSCDREPEVINNTINRSLDVKKVDELKEIVRCNKDKYVSQELDTILVSREVRQLLLSNTIGQRLFAKLVVGLSQGTVSELLSKPKPWSKLTEKGKDSYRKMYAWASDEKAILLLRSFNPKKAKYIGSSAVYKCNNSNARLTNRVSNTFGEIIKPMKDQPEACPKNESIASCYAEVESNKRKKDNDNILQKEITKIYQDEYVDQIGGTIHNVQSRCRKISSSSESFANNVSNERKQFSADVYTTKTAITASQHHIVEYPHNILNSSEISTSDRKEINELPRQHLPTHDGIVCKSQSFCKELQKSLERARKRKSDELSSENDQDESALHKKSFVNILQHRHTTSDIKYNTQTEDAEQPVTDANFSSHLLSNSGMSNAESFVGSAQPSAFHHISSFNKSVNLRPGTPVHHILAHRPTKFIPPAITQEQFEMFNDLDTAETVRKVKDILSKHPITQRLFGESVLGLSQGSVSDLLTHPKPWHMLTQKGREPYIRMQMFLEDGNAVRKLAANQYNAASCKFIKSLNCSNNEDGQSVYKTAIMPDTSLSLESNMLQNKQTSAPCILSETLSKNNGSETPEDSTLKILDHTYSNKVTIESSTDRNLCIISFQQNQQQLHQDYSKLQRFQHHASPNVYEAAALTQELDTQSITSRVKDILLENQIGQKIFGEVVLGLSQGSVSELLSKPKPWKLLSIKGREPFIRMQIWLNDPQKIEKIYAYKRKKLEMKKQVHNFKRNEEDHSGKITEISRTSTDDNASQLPYTVRSDCGSPFSKKQRILLSNEQKEALQLAFTLDSYPSSETIDFLQNELSLSSETITNWFKNIRQRLKDQASGSLSVENQSSLPVTQQLPLIPKLFDPLYFRFLLNQRFLEHNSNDNQINVPFPFSYLWYIKQYQNLISQYNFPFQNTGSNEALKKTDHSLKQNCCLDLSKCRTEYDAESETEYDLKSQRDNGSICSDISSYFTEDKPLKIESMAVSTQTTDKRRRTSRRKSTTPKRVSPQWNEYHDTLNDDDNNDDRK